MNTPYGLEIIDSCMNCKLRKEHSFCNMSYGLLKSLSARSHQCTYPGEAVLFVEGQMPRGAFMLCSGQVKLSTTSREGKVLILKIAEAGDVLGAAHLASVGWRGRGVVQQTAIPPDSQPVDGATLCISQTFEPITAPLPITVSPPRIVALA